jgi:hypothetical protein
VSSRTVVTIWFSWLDQDSPFPESIAQCHRYSASLRVAVTVSPGVESDRGGPVGPAVVHCKSWVWSLAPQKKKSSHWAHTVPLAEFSFCHPHSWSVLVTFQNPQSPSLGIRMVLLLAGWDYWTQNGPSYRTDVVRLTNPRASRNPFFFLFLMILGFELRALYLLGRYSTT